MKKTSNDILIPFLTILIDIMAIEGAFFFTFWLRFFSPLTIIFPVTKGIPELYQYFLLSLFTIPVWILLFNRRGLYRPRRVNFFSDEFFVIIRMIVIGMLLLLAGTFFYREYEFSRLTFLLLCIVAILFISSGRFLILEFEKFWYKLGRDVKKVIVAGANEATERIFSSIFQRPSLGYDIIGYFAERSSDKMNDLGARYLGGEDLIPEFIAENGIPTILISYKFEEHQKIENLVFNCAGINVEILVVPDFFEIMTSRMRIQEIQGIPFIPVKMIPFNIWNQFLKRTFDFSIGTFCFILFLPLLLIISLAIKLTSQGPVLYIQERVGLDGKPFKLLKFRTMNTNAEAISGPVWAKKGDSRITKVGKFLRRFSLDELPQLVNVLKGNMSIVGPRPERPFFVEKFKNSIPKYIDRHRVKTGMTGWAQVNGLRGNSSIEERTKYDVYYVENWSLVFDVKIILKTIRAVLFGTDAY
jgi:exopolysaccharide biosynthesis polyprenyl glycosylphosphotransferase